MINMISKLRISGWRSPKKEEFYNHIVALPMLWLLKFSRDKVTTLNVTRGR